jgi:glycosyltransferase involved in cell wall biosynthesis
MASERLLINGIFLRAGRVGGAEFMLHGLVEGIARLGLPVTLLLPAENAFVSVDFLSHIEVLERESDLRVHRARTIGNRFLTEALETSGANRKFSANAIVSPNYFTPPLCGVPAITAILDLQYLHFPQHFSAQKRVWLRLAHMHTLKQARFVPVISDFVRRDIVARLGDRSERKLVVIPVPVAWQRFTPSPSLPDSSGLTRPFVLSVASHYAHKNLGTLVRAFALIARRVPHDLVLVGQRRAQLIGTRFGGAGDLEQLVSSLGLTERVRFTGHVSDAEVGWYYRNATAFVFPSLFEGFGMPIVEALGHALPVITTDRGSLPEVSRGLAHAVRDPLDADELAERLERILQSPAAYAPSAEAVAGLRNDFSAETVGREYVRLAREAVHA